MELGQHSAPPADDLVAPDDFVYWAAMRAIGPYVVRREVRRRAGAGPGGGGAPGGRLVAPALWATDRLTGMPALLHPVEVSAPLPSLPAHPALLPFTDQVAEVAHSYLVTELPLDAEPETDPERAARGALEALAFLHGQGLTHGALGTEQFWRVGDDFRLTGAGLPRPGRRPTAADDLRDLARALGDLGPLPAALDALGEGPSAPAPSAQALLGRLNGEPAPSSTPDAEQSSEEADEGGAAAPPVDTAPEPPPALRPPAPFDLILTPPAPRGTGPKEAETATVGPATPPMDDPADDIAEMRRRNVDEAPPHRPPQPPEPTAGAPAVRPPPARRAPAATRASERLRADSRRMLDRSAERRDQVAAQVAAEGSEIEMAALPGAPEIAETPQAETPQERRRRELRARQQEEALREQLAALRRAHPAPDPQEGEAPPRPAREAGDDIAEFRRRGREETPTSAAAPLQTPPPQKRQLGPVRIGWDRRGERQLIRSQSPRTQLLRWLLPVLGVLVLAFALSLLVREMRPAPPAVAAPAPGSAPGAGECCVLQLQLAGVGAGERAALTLVRPPPGVTLAGGATLGELPGEVRFPAPGLYRVQVSTLAPAAPRSRVLDLRVPNPERLTVSLEE